MTNSLTIILKRIGLLQFSIKLKRKISILGSLYKWSKLQGVEHLYLELGSGAKKGTNGWITVDLFGADISHDLRKGIPLPANSVEKIYTSHMFEHIPYKELVAFINECFRVLKPNGELLVCVPDASLFIKAYTTGQYFLKPDQLYKPADVNTGSLIDQVNYIAYMDGQHNYMFDSENLINTLRKAPFKSTKLREFNEKIDMKSRAHESIYAIGVK